MSDHPPIDVRPDLWPIVRDILRRHVPNHEVWAFGSRVQGRTKPCSDLDLAVISGTPLPWNVAANLQEAFSESDLPWRVDVVDWATTSPSVRAIIERQKVVVQPATQWRDQNKAMWDAKTPLHLASREYDVAGFKAGGNRLRKHEIADVGDVTGRDLIHLQCHFGLDTLSWARLGARVTGVDFSAPAIVAATRLAAETGLQADFVTDDVYDAPAAVGHRTFDIVYTGVGALCWLPDMTRWARVVHDLLRPGGELYLFEFHPVRWMIIDSPAEALLVRDSYFTAREGYVSAGGVTYADASIPAAATPTVQWNHDLGEIVTALVQAGLRIDSLREMDGSVLREWDGMVAGEDGMFRMPPDRPSLPLMFTLRARRA